MFSQFCDQRWVFLIILGGLVLLLYMGLHPNPVLVGGLDETSLLGIAGDYWLHAIVFMVISMMVIVLSSTRHSWIISLLVIMAIGSELLQGMTPWRVFDYYDIVANLIGIVVGLGIVGVMKAIQRSKHEPMTNSLV